MDLSYLPLLFAREMFKVVWIYVSQPQGTRLFQLLINEPKFGAAFTLKLSAVSLSLSFRAEIHSERKQNQPTM